MIAPLTDEARARLREAAEKATPGPWRFVEIGGEGFALVVHSPQSWRIAEVMTWEGPGRDAAYIAAADPTTVRALLDENERLRARRAVICPKCGGDPDIPATTEVSTPDGPMETWDGVSTYRCDNCENGAVLVDP